MACFVTFAYYYFIILSTSFTTIHGLFSQQSVSAIRMEKLTRLHFYFHDIRGGQNPTAIRIVGPPNKSVGSFGTSFMMDDPLTEEPEASSKLVGRAQGIYAFASQHDSGLLMVLNFAFIEGMYNGSTLSILGRNPFMDTIRDAYRRRQWGFPLCTGLCIGKNIFLKSKNWRCCRPVQCVCVAPLKGASHLVSKRGICSF